MDWNPIVKNAQVNGKNNHIEQLEWVKRNPQKRSIILKEYRQRHPEAVLARIALRRAKKLQAVPSWFEKEAVNSLYKERKRISEETGIEHHVDHIVPLNGKFVSGLHCLDNLKIITAVENIAKNNTFIINTEE